MANDYRAYLNKNDHYSFILEDLLLGGAVKVDSPDVVHRAVLKVWNLSILDGNGAPRCIRTVPLLQHMEEEDISVFWVSEDEQLLLFGCDNGRIFYLHVTTPMGLKTRAIWCA